MKGSLYDQILLFGDSITEFSEAQIPIPLAAAAIDNEKPVEPTTFSFALAPALRNAYSRRLEVANRGLSGYNTDLALRVVHRIVPAPEYTKVRLMTVFFGANDSCFPLKENNQCVPLPEFRENLKKIVNHPAVKAHSPKIVFITPPPIDETRQMMIDQRGGYPRRRTAENTKLYADAVIEVAKELNMPCCDLWSAFARVAGWKPGAPLPGLEGDIPHEAFNALFSDGLHLTGAGYSIVYRELAEVIRTQVPELMPEALPMILPEWKKITADMTF